MSNITSWGGFNEEDIFIISFFSPREMDTQTDMDRSSVSEEGVSSTLTHVVRTYMHIFSVVSTAR